MSTADDLRDLRDALDSIAHGALPRWGKPTTKTGEEAQRAAVEVYKKWICALHFEGAAKASVEKLLAAEDEHRTHSEILTECVERLERERDHERKVANEQLARAHDAVRERDELKAEVERAKDACNAYWHDLMRIASLCEQTLDDPSTLDAVKRVVRERDEARAQAERLRALLDGYSAGAGDG